MERVPLTSAVIIRVTYLAKVLLRLLCNILELRMIVKRVYFLEGLHCRLETSHYLMVR